MNKLILLVVSFVVAGHVYSAEDLYSKTESILIKKDNEQLGERESSQQYDFFGSSIQREQDRIKQQEKEVGKIYDEKAITANMSPHDKSQYLLRNNDLNTLNKFEINQQIKSNQEGRNKGIITERDYQKRLVELNSKKK
ncbi:hypothetical protein EAH57_05335 [Acinetobacter sp. 2JN-4]|uniref:hypothetical protein n=1 Tax=Acinetobacter sp. 2JN-4 TaxID=2479844 RepID=UPI000EF9D8DA|nr:hypothetical protein [Acinetobacter sp. 2JN-4]RLZ09331.1 hypothetical protein EAH57_05335 [Acinetobacter sp. 2JN-4]